MNKDLNNYKSISEIFRDSLFMIWKNKNLKASPDCYYCPAISMRGVGYSYIPLREKGNTFSPDEISCKITKRNLEYLLESELK